MPTFVSHTPMAGKPASPLSRPPPLLSIPGKAMKPPDHILSSELRHDRIPSPFRTRVGFENPRIARLPALFAEVLFLNRDSIGRQASPVSGGVPANFTCDQSTHSSRRPGGEGPLSASCFFLKPSANSRIDTTGSSPPLKLAMITIVKIKMTGARQPIATHPSADFIFGPRSPQWGHVHVDFATPFPQVSHGTSCATSPPLKRWDVDISSREKIISYPTSIY
jgi:hypothetical protein